MLGWFKKKFGKKPVEEAALEPELKQEEILVPEAEETTLAGVESVGDAEKPAGEEVPIGVEEQVFSISPHQDGAFDVAGELDQFFPESEPEPGAVEELAEEDLTAAAAPQAAEVTHEVPRTPPEPLIAAEFEAGADQGQLTEPTVEDFGVDSVDEENAAEVCELIPEEAPESPQVGREAEDISLPAEAAPEEPATIAPGVAEAVPVAEVSVVEAVAVQVQPLEQEAEESVAVEPEAVDVAELIVAVDEAPETEEEASEGETGAAAGHEPDQQAVEAEERCEGTSPLPVAPESVLEEIDQPPAAEEQAPDEVADDEALEGDEHVILPASPLAEKTQEKPASKSLFKRLRDRLGKTRDAFVYRLDRLFLGKKEIDQDLFEQLEEILITADLGVSTTLELIDRARKKVKRDQLSDPQALKAIIRDEILAYIVASDKPAELVMPEEGPFVIMVVGVNGVGKTTTIGKVAAKFVRAGQSVLLVAGDTFRAAAINQLRIWGERVGVEVIAQKPGADPSSVVFDGLEYGVAHGYDVILIDTAGRLHTSVNLMEELKKIKRVIGKKMPGAPHEVMLVLDATTGQNGISQAKMFHETVGVSGLALTKLDGTAKGGIVANVCREIGIPVRFIGIGEQIDDLRDFEAHEFVDALFAESDR